MCSISGAIFPAMKTNLPGIESAYENLRRTIIQAEDRGRDSFGFISISRDGKTRQVKKVIGKPSDHPQEFSALYNSEVALVINNNRAEPTTEYVSEKRSEDIQPFTYKGWVVAHNGTIANDKELEKKYRLKRDTTIDSAIIPAFLDYFFGDDFASPEDVVSILSKELVGSYALAIARADDPTKLILMTNYKPLYVAYNQIHGYYLFSSLENYLQSKDPVEKLNSHWQVTAVPAYSAMIFENGQWRSMALPSKEEKVENKKALVVCSGGLDSTVVAAKAIKEGYDVTLLHFRYQCRAETREVKAVTAIGRKLNCEVLFVDTDIFKEVIKGSPLTNTKDVGGDISKGEAGVEFAHEWVPARNLIMLSIATGIAEAQGFETLMLGNNLEESGAYPDNEMEFINKLNEVLPFATQVNKKVRIKMPVGNLMKHEIVRLGLEINAPLDLCWSCYEAAEKHCGECGPCTMRKIAFEINGIPDSLEYLK